MNLTKALAIALAVSSIINLSWGVETVRHHKSHTTATSAGAQIDQSDCVDPSDYVMCVNADMPEVVIGKVPNQPITTVICKFRVVLGGVLVLTPNEPILVTDTQRTSLQEGETYDFTVTVTDYGSPDTHVLLRSLATLDKAKKTSPNQSVDPLYCDM